MKLYVVLWSYDWKRMEKVISFLIGLHISPLLVHDNVIFLVLFFIDGESVGLL